MIYLLNIYQLQFSFQFTIQNLKNINHFTLRYKKSIDATTVSIIKILFNFK